MTLHRRGTTHAFIAGLGAVVVLSVGGGCAGGGREAVADRRADEARANEARVELESEETELPRVPAQALLPLEERRHVFDIVEGDNRGEQAEFTLRETNAGEPGDWVMTMGELDALYLERDEEGNVLLVRMDLPDEGYRIKYDPAVRLIPSRVEPDLRDEEQAQAHVHDLESGARQHSGAARHVIKSVTRSRFHTPNGEQDGYMVAIEHEIDLGLAQVAIEMESGYLPGDGLVYRRMKYTITRLGLFGTTTRQTAVIAE